MLKMRLLTQSMNYRCSAAPAGFKGAQLASPGALGLTLTPDAEAVDAMVDLCSSCCVCSQWVRVRTDGLQSSTPQLPSSGARLLETGSEVSLNIPSCF